MNQIKIQRQKFTTQTIHVMVGIFLTEVKIIQLSVKKVLFRVINKNNILVLFLDYIHI